MISCERSDFNVKEAEVEPAATVTEEGAVIRLFTVETVTAVPPVPAPLLNVIVHELEAFGASTTGLQLKLEIRRGATRLTEAFTEFAPYVAVIEAL